MVESHISKLDLNESREQSKFLMLAGIALNSRGPSTKKDLSFRVLMAALDPERGGMAANVPLLLSDLVAREIPQLGTSPLRIFHM